MGAGHLDPAAFRAMLDANPQIADVELSNYGEMFLNPRLPELLRIAHERQVVVHAENGANLNHASPATLEALVLYQLRSMTVSIDGASPESYAKYRVKGDFDRVIANIRILNEFKRKHRSAFPFLAWQYVVFGHNEHELEAAKRLAAELGMAFRPKISWDKDFSPIRDPQLVQIQTGLRTTRDEHYNATGSAYARSICYQLWTAPVLNWNGRLMGCCRNFWGDFGANAFEDGLAQALASPKLHHAREALMGRVALDPATPCATCDLYLTMERDKNWIVESEVPDTKNSAVAVSIVPEPGNSPATHVDIFVTPGLSVNRLLLARPPRAQRVQLSTQYFVLLSLPPGEYTIYALPRQLDPNYRTQYPPLPPATMPVTIEPRPILREFHIPLT